MAAGVEVHVVPGVSSAFAAPLLAGIPVTHRGASRGVSVVTAVAEAGVEVDFETLAVPGMTLVVLMGVARRASIATQLLSGGLAPETPVAVVERAARRDQRVTRGRLDELAGLDVHSPAVIVVGEVAALELGLVESLSTLAGVA